VFRLENSSFALAHGFTHNHTQQSAQALVIQHRSFSLCFFLILGLSVYPEAAKLSLYYLLTRGDYAP